MIIDMKTIHFSDKDKITLDDFINIMGLENETVFASQVKKAMKEYNDNHKHAMPMKPSLDPWFGNPNHIESMHIITESGKITEYMLNNKGNKQLMLRTCYALQEWVGKTEKYWGIDITRGLNVQI